LYAPAIKEAAMPIEPVPAGQVDKRVIRNLTNEYAWNWTRGNRMPPWLMIRKINSQWWDNVQATEGHQALLWIALLDDPHSSVVPEGQWDRGTQLRGQL
jgi:hypothetical protein